MLIQTVYNTQFANYSYLTLNPDLVSPNLDLLMARR